MGLQNSTWEYKSSSGATSTWKTTNGGTKWTSTNNDSWSNSGSTWTYKSSDTATDSWTTSDNGSTWTYKKLATISGSSGNWTTDASQEVWTFTPTTSGDATWKYDATDSTTPKWEYTDTTNHLTGEKTGSGDWSWSYSADNWTGTKTGSGDWTWNYKVSDSETWTTSNDGSTWTNNGATWTKGTDGSDTTWSDGTNTWKYNTSNSTWLKGTSTSSTDGNGGTTTTWTWAEDNSVAQPPSFLNETIPTPSVPTSTPDVTLPDVPNPSLPNVPTSAPTAGTSIPSNTPFTASTPGTTMPTIPTKHLPPLISVPTLLSTSTTWNGSQFENENFKTVGTITSDSNLVSDDETAWAKRRHIDDTTSSTATISKETEIFAFKISDGSDKGSVSVSYSYKDLLGNNGKTLLDLANEITKHLATKRNATVKLENYFNTENVVANLGNNTFTDKENLSFYNNGMISNLDATGYTGKATLYGNDNATVREENDGNNLTFTLGTSNTFSGTDNKVKIDGVSYQTDENRITVGDVTYDTSTASAKDTATVSITQDVDG